MNETTTTGLRDWIDAHRPVGDGIDNSYVAASMLHHATPTVNDLLREFAARSNQAQTLEEADALVEEFGRRVREAMRDE